MKTTPQVSVIIPVYNTERYLEKCLSSLMQETMADIEFLVINDGSPDNSEEIIQCYVQKDSRFVYYPKPNGGLSDARNYGIERAKGEFIGFIDSDDWVAEGMFGKLHRKAMETGAEIVVCGVSYMEEKPASTEGHVAFRKKDSPIGEMHLYDADVFTSPRILLDAKAYAWNKLYHRSLFAEVRYPVGQLFEDISVTYRLLSQAKKVSAVNEYLYYYRVGREGAITTTFNRRIFEFFTAMNTMLEDFRNREIFERFEDELCGLTQKHTVARINSFKYSKSLYYRLRFVGPAMGFLTKNFPEWRNNKYYLQELPMSAVRRGIAFLKAHVWSVYLLALIYPLFPKMKGLLSFLKGAGKDQGRRAEDTPIPSTEEMQEVQAEKLSILSAIHRVCKERGLLYYLAEGTLLAALRGVPIPTESALEIAMPRRDYERLAEIWSGESVDGCVLLEPKTDSDYGLPFVQIIGGENASHAVKQQSILTKGQGLSVNVFPLDTVPPYETREAFQRACKIKKVQSMMLYKAHALKSKSERIVCFFRGADLRSMASLQHRLQKLSTAMASAGGEHYANFASPHHPRKETFPKGWWGEPKDRLFSDGMFSFPECPEQILDRVYGAGGREEDWYDFE